MHVLLLAVCCIVSGHVHTASGAPIAGAHVVVEGRSGGGVVTTADGSFSLSVPPGDHQLDLSSKGYLSASVDIVVGHDTTVDVTLEPVDAPTLRTIAAVTVDGRLTPVRGVVPSVTVTRSDMDRINDDRIIQALATIPGTVFAHPDGGSAAGIAVVALRGPDPSESLDALDGQLLNDGNTGDLNLAHFPVAAFSSVNVTEGLGPEDANGSNTFGGSINMVSLRPTLHPHFAFQESVGSFGQSEQWVNGTGTHGKFGYAFALDNQNTAGYTNETQTLYTAGVAPGTPQNPGTPTFLGSSTSSRSELANLTYNFTSRANIAARIFVLGDNNDQSSGVNGIDGNSTSPTYGDFVGPGSQSYAQTVRAYQVRAQAPLGAGDLAADVYASDNNIALFGPPSNPAYDVDHVDHRYNLGLTWARTFDTSEYAVGGYSRYESLAFVPPAGPAPQLGQTINVLFARGGWQATKELRVDAGLFQSRYTSFGSNLDGRLGLIYNTSPSTALRFSLGTGFRAPLLIERYQFPLDQLAQDGLGVFVGQGNPNESPEHATEYELGVSHQFSSATLDVSLYQTNLRNPIEIYYPLELAQSGVCGAQTPTAPVPGCVSYNSNVGNAVYQGAEVRFVQRFAPEHLFLTAMYGLNVAYPKDLTADFSNPTSAGNLVDNTQFLGIPQQQGSLELDWAENAWHAGAQAVFRGNNNELNQPPFTVINATVGVGLTKFIDFSVQGTNIFSDAAGRYTIFGGGVPYLGFGGTPLPTDRYTIEPVGVRAILTLKT
ncbi:MAG: TonB-dependent receptor [Candidatus Eremiobacteraeota bacterium]|nr:TonB-dependent receptor [Candidatus Eremiobacteraeota bacterium]